VKYLPEIIIDNDALTYIKNHGIAIHLGSFKLGCNFQARPTVNVGKPEFPANFEIINVNGIDVYLSKNLLQKNPSERFIISLESDTRLLVTGDNKH